MPSEQVSAIVPTLYQVNQIIKPTYENYMKNTSERAPRRTVTARRNTEFVRRALRIWRQACLRGEALTLRRLAILTVFGGADHFYICYNRALQEVYRYRLDRARGHFCRPCEERVGRTRIRHIVERVEALLAANPRMKVTEALTLVFAAGGAPRFYIGIERGMAILRANEISFRHPWAHIDESPDIP